MLKTMGLRKRHEKMLADAAALRDQLTTFKTREADLAAQVEAATTDEEIAAAAAAVAEMESAQKTAQERLDTIISEAEAIQREIAAAVAAAEAAAAESGATGEEGRAAGASFQRRCQEFQRTGRMVYQNARSMIMRAAVTTGSNGVIGPTGVSGINDAAGNAVSDFIDLMKITDATGMAAYKVAYIGSLATCCIYANAHLAKFGKQLVCAIDDGRDYLARDEQFVATYCR